MRKIAWGRRDGPKCVRIAFAGRDIVFLTSVNKSKDMGQIDQWKQFSVMKKTQKAMFLIFKKIEDVY